MNFWRLFKKNIVDIIFFQFSLFYRARWRLPWFWSSFARLVVVLNVNDWSCDLFFLAWGMDHPNLSSSFLIRFQIRSLISILWTSLGFFIHAIVTQQRLIATNQSKVIFCMIGLLWVDILIINILKNIWGYFVLNKSNYRWK